MEAWQVVMNLIVVGCCTIAFRWAGFLGSVAGVIVYTVLSA